MVVPAADAERFLREYYPGLRRVLPVESTDGTVELPEVAPPRLALRLVYGPGHRLHLAWSFRYDLGGAAQHVPLDDGGATAARDPAAEAALLRALTLPAEAPAALWTARPRGRAGRHRRAARPGRRVFTEEVLPALRDQGVVVEIEGEARSTGAPTPRRSSASPPSDSADDPDWFDLGVSVELDGEDVPFDALFVGPRPRREPPRAAHRHVLRLDRPELDQLRQLIDEAARAGGPRAGTSCGSAPTRPACGTSCARSASSRRRASGGPAPSRTCSTARPPPRRRSRPGSPRSCAPTSSTAPAG